MVRLVEFAHVLLDKPPPLLGIMVAQGTVRPVSDSYRGKANEAYLGLAAIHINTSTIFARSIL
jgi:hypothetical protein